jgi:hypothetical protein
MPNRVRYYITESDDRAVVRSVPVTISTQPANRLMEIEDRPEQTVQRRTSVRKPVGRIVKVLRKPATSARA